MNELELIELLTRSLATNSSVVVGPGDDCAVLDFGMESDWLLFKTDAVVEGVHFTTDTEPQKVGRKALARCLSDIAAMAGRPTAAVVTLGLPQDFKPTIVQEIYEGLNGLAREHKVAVVGGETVRNPGGIVLSIAMVGTVEKNRCVRRSGAQPGDAIFVTGELGGSLAGRHLDFEPRIGEARWLASSFAIHSMIDLSDGLATDLPRILQASNVGGELLAEAVPISRAARVQARENSTAKTALHSAMTDGEDFELLFTVASKDAVPLLDAFKSAFPETPLACIGKITVEPGLRIRDKQGLRPLTGNGYVHFQKP